MKVICTLYRVCQFPTNHITANIEKGEPATILDRVAKRFGRLAPRFELFFQDRKSLAGMEVMTFDMQVADMPQSGLVTTDPIIPEELNRIDGGLRGEMERLGIDQKGLSFEWRMKYTVKGN